MRRDVKNEKALDRLRTISRVRMLRQATELAYDFTHVERVWRNCRIIEHHARGEEAWDVDGDILEISALLHEIGRGSERVGESATQASVRIAEELLREEKLGHFVWPVCSAILAQDRQRSSFPRTPEGQILADAETLEALGALGVVRCILTGAGRATPSLYDFDDPKAEARKLDPAAFLIDCFPAFLFDRIKNVYTNFAKQEATRRMRIVQAFYDTILQEAGLR